MIKVSAGYDKVTEFFDESGRYLKQLKILETNVPPITELKTIITETLTLVLVPYRIFAKYSEGNRLVSTHYVNWLTVHVSPHMLFEVQIRHFSLKTAGS